MAFGLPVCYFFCNFACTNYIRDELKKMKANKILFISQEITPFVPESPMAKAGRYLPQATQDL